METITKLTAFASKLEEKGLMSLASDVDGATATLIKIAKELGPQGYWMQNSRCWAGCYRKKRASQPRTSAQDIWFECQEEYEKAIAGNSDSWSKYAEADAGLVKTAQNDQFADTVRLLVASGEGVGDAVFGTIASQISELQFGGIEAADALINVSNSLAEDNIELSTEAASLASEMTKLAYGFGGVKDMFAPLTNKFRGLTKNVNLTNIKTLLQQLNNTLMMYVNQKRDFEGALNKSNGLPPDLKKTLQQGLRPLSQQSMTNMLGAVDKYTKLMQKNPGDAQQQIKNQENQSAADRLTQMTGGQPAQAGQAAQTGQSAQGPQQAQQSQSDVAKAKDGTGIPSDPDTLDKDQNGVRDNAQQGQNPKLDKVTRYWSKFDPGKMRSLLEDAKALYAGKNRGELFRLVTAAPLSGKALRDKAKGGVPGGIPVTPPIGAKPVMPGAVPPVIPGASAVPPVTPIPPAPVAPNGRPAAPVAPGAANDAMAKGKVEQIPTISPAVAPKVPPTNVTAPAGAMAGPAGVSSTSAAPAAPVAPTAPVAPKAKKAKPAPTSKPAPVAKPAPAATPTGAPTPAADIGLKPMDEPTGPTPQPLTATDFAMEFGKLSPEAQDHILKQLEPDMAKAEQGHHMGVQNDQNADAYMAMAKTKKQLFKLA